MIGCKILKFYEKCIIGTRIYFVCIFQVFWLVVDKKFNVFKNSFVINFTVFIEFRSFFTVSFKILNISKSAPISNNNHYQTVGMNVKIGACMKVTVVLFGEKKH